MLGPREFQSRVPCFTWHKGFTEGRKVRFSWTAMDSKMRCVGMVSSSLLCPVEEQSNRTPT